MCQWGDLHRLRATPKQEECQLALVAAFGKPDMLPSLLGWPMQKAPIRIVGGDHWLLVVVLLLLLWPWVNKWRMENAEYLDQTNALPY